MKIAICIFVSFVFLISCTRKVYDHSGHYEGIINRDTVNIKVAIDLHSDSTYTINIEYTFSPWCNYGSGILSYKGNWTAIKDKIFFNRADVSSINQWGRHETYTKDDLEEFSQKYKWTKRESKAIWKMQQKHYHSVLKIEVKESGCNKIRFHLGIDCFEEIWDYWYVQKVNCN